MSDYDFAYEAGRHCTVTHGEAFVFFCTGVTCGIILLRLLINAHLAPAFAPVFS